MSSEPARAVFVARPNDGVAIDLSIIIPAYNEAFRLPVVLEALRHHVDASTTEVIVVDDGSDDETAEIARRATEWVKHLVVLAHDVNRGKGAAVRTGVAVARGDVIAFVDADNQTDLAALQPMIAALSPTVGAVFGSRHAPGASVTGAPVIRGLMGRVFNHLVRRAAGTSIRDTQCGAKVFRGSAARIAFANVSIDGFAFDVEILRRLLAMGLGVVEYPVSVHHVPGTKIRLSTPIFMLRDILRIRMSRHAGTPDYIDADYSIELGACVDPLFAGKPLAEGDRCRVAVPFEVTEVTEQLRRLGQDPHVRRSATWSEFLRAPR